MSNQPPYPPPTPDPYQPPGSIPYVTPGAFDTYRPHSTAARTAGIVQIVLGSLTTLLSFCLLGGGMMINASMLTPEQKAQFDSLGVDLATAQRMVLLVAGLCMALPGILYIILGAFIVRGSSGAAMASIVLTALVLLLNLAGLANSALAGVVEGMFTSAVMLLASGVLLALLIWAYRDLRRLKRETNTPWPAPYYQNQPYPPLAGQQPLPPPPPPTRPEDLPPPPV